LAVLLIIHDLAEIIRSEITNFYQKAKVPNNWCAARSRIFLYRF